MASITLLILEIKNVCQETELYMIVLQFIRL